MVLLEGGAEAFLAQLRAFYQQCDERGAGTVYLTMKATTPRESKKDAAAGKRGDAGGAAAGARPAAASAGQDEGSQETRLLARAKLSFNGKKISTWVSLQDSDAFKAQVAAMQEQYCRKTAKKRAHKEASDVAAAARAAASAGGAKHKRRRGAKRPDKEKAAEDGKGLP
ncbi:hypothetical protein JKP88DRAFT_229860 [Tribonema minus]|uniref:Signal recognition particle 14 kDa protein n=1 Tax=Tribonema minus TaxID=303371 RepID=A0A835ZGB4_9STRA|nr:hypothetical protein JKP88DRAFT_229860 [Tribonema minus]